MPKGAYTQKQERKADHIAEGYRKEGVSKKEAEERAWRTVNKQDKGGKNDGSGRSAVVPLPRRRVGKRGAVAAANAAAARGFRSRARARAVRCVPACRCGLPASCQRPAADPARARPASVSLSCRRRRLSGSGCRSTSPARTSASTARLTAGAPRFTLAATWFNVPPARRVDRGQQVALLAHGLGHGGVAAQLFDQSCEARRQRAR